MPDPLIISACVTVITASNFAGLFLIYRALTSDPPDKFEPLAPEYDSITINSDLEGLH